MIGMNYGINRGLLHVAARLHILTASKPSSSLRLSAYDQTWLHSLYQSNSVALKAWDRIPVSILRYSIESTYSKDLLPDDDRFARAALNTTLASEACNFVTSSKCDPLLVLGIPHKIFAWYSNLDLMTRIRVCDSAKFELKIRVNPKRLSAEDSAESALYNTMLILSSELNLELKKNTSIEKYNGSIEDYGRTPHETQEQMRDMLAADIRQLYIINATGFTDEEIINAKRSLDRKGLYKAGKKSKGRMPDPSRVYSTNPAALSFFMLLYKIFGKDIEHGLNTKAAIYAYRHFKHMMSFMGFRPEQIPHINDCFCTINGSIQGYLVQSQCVNTRIHFLQRPDKPVRCACYDQVCKSLKKQA